MHNETDIEILVEIRFERPLSICVVPAREISALYPGDERLIWLPRAEIRAVKPEPNGRATITIPRWLADAKRLLARTEDDANQGSLL